MKLLHGRHVGPLLTVWAAAFVLSGFLYWIQNANPAFSEMLPPLYIIIVVAAIIASIKWFRERQRYHDRRHDDRRRAERRHPRYPAVSDPEERNDAD